VNFGKFPEACEYKRYLKKPIPVKALQIPEEFQVETLEGVMKGKAGDYLMEGVHGEVYPCDKDIFEKTYEEYGGPDDNESRPNRHGKDGKCCCEKPEQSV